MREVSGINHIMQRAQKRTMDQSMQRVVLLHKIMPGIADGSFGLEVAAVAQYQFPYR